MLKIIQPKFIHYTHKQSNLQTCQVEKGVLKIYIYIDMFQKDHCKKNYYLKI